MSQTRDVVTMQQVAQDIIDYLLTYSNEKERDERRVKLDIILKEARALYAGDGSTLAGLFKKYFVYPFSRTRKNEIASAIDALSRCEDEQFARFVIVADLLKANGAYKSTSLHTIILDKLIETTGKYKPLSEDKRLTEKAKEDLRSILRDAIIAKAERCIVENIEVKQRVDETQKDVKPKSHFIPARIVLPKVVQEELERVLAGRSKKKTKSPVQGMEPTLFAARQKELSDAFTKGTLAKKIPVKVTPMDIGDNPTFKESLAVIRGFFAAKYKVKPVEQKFPKQYADIAKHFGVK